MSRHRAHRLWRLAGLQLPRRRPRRRVAHSRPRPLPAFGANHVWAYDFVFDTCANGQSLKCLTVIDEFTREALAIDVAGSIRSGRVIEVLTRLDQRTWRTALPALRQRPGVRQQGDPRVARDRRHPDRTDRSWQAVAERCRRELQRSLPRRMPEPGVVPQSSRSEGDHRNLASALQCREATFEPRLPDADRVPTASRVHQPGSRSQVTNGPRIPGQVITDHLPGGIEVSSAAMKACPNMATGPADERMVEGLLSGNASDRNGSIPPLSGRFQRRGPTPALGPRSGLWLRAPSDRLLATLRLKCCEFPLLALSAAQKKGRSRAAQSTALRPDQGALLPSPIARRWRPF